MASLEERFWQKVDVKAEEDCWLWTANKNNKGYGMIRQGGVMPKILAHRASYIIHNGEVEENLCVLHKCDNPSCVNPNHLFLGTHQENMADKMKKGRHRYGVNPNNRPPVYHGTSHPSSKFSESDIADIRDRINHESCASIARSYGVNKSTILSIKNGKTYNHQEHGVCSHR